MRFHTQLNRQLLETGSPNHRGHSPEPDAKDINRWTSRASFFELLDQNARSPAIQNLAAPMKLEGMNLGDSGAAFGTGGSG